MENEYSSLISGNTYNIYTSDKRRLEVGEDQKVNIKPKFPKGFQHTTVTTRLEGTKMVLNFTVDQELLKLFSSGTVNIDGVKETRSVTSLCDPITVDNKNHTIEIRWSRDIIEILYANKIEKSEEPELNIDYICKFYNDFLNQEDRDNWNSFKERLREHGIDIPDNYHFLMCIYGDFIGETVKYKKAEDIVNGIVLDGQRLDVRKDLIFLDLVGIEGITIVLANLSKYGVKEVHDVEISVNDVPVKLNDEIIFNSSVIVGSPFSLSLLKEVTIKDLIAGIAGNYLDTVNLYEGLEDLPQIMGIFEQINLPKSLKRLYYLQGNFSELDLPIGLETIGLNGQGYIHSDNLTSIRIPNTVKTIESSSFTDNDNLEEVILDCTGTSGLSFNYSDIFLNCPIKKVTILSNPDDDLVVPIISGYVFGEDPELIIFVNPEKVDLYKEDENWSIYSDYIYAQIAPTENSINAEFNISDGAKASPKTQITIGNKINDVVPFSRIIVDNKYELDLTRDIKFYESNILYDFKEPGRHTVEYVLSNPNELGAGMFNGCDEMTNIVIPNSVNSIGSYALVVDCPIIFSSTTPATLVDSNYTFSKGAVIMVPEEAYNTYLTAWGEIDINIIPGDIISSITCTIGTDGGTTNIAYVKESEKSPFISILMEKESGKVVDINKYAHIKEGYLQNEFEPGTYTLTYNFPGTKIFDNIYKNIEIIKVIEISNTVAEIGNYAFAGTDFLEVTIPKTITNIGNEAFKKVVTVHMLGTVPPQIKSDSFANEATIYVPEGYVSTYQTAYSNYSYTILEDQPKPEATGWTPYDPLEMTGEEFVKSAGLGELENGYFYNVTTSFKESDPGLYVVIEKGKYKPFDLNNSMLKSELDYLAHEAQLGIDVVYYTTDTEQVFLALKPSECIEIERNSPEPKGTGWTPEDPIDVTGEEFLEALDYGDLKNGYFYNVTTSLGDKIIAGLYVITEKIGNGYKPFDLNNSMTVAEFDLLVKAEELVIDTVYYVTDREEVCLADSSTKYQIIDRESPEPPQPTEYSYTIEDDTDKVYPTDAWDNSFYINVDYDPKGKGVMALWFGADKNTTAFEKEANFSVSYKGTVITNGTFSYNSIKDPAPILSVEDWEEGSYDFVLDSPGKEYHRHYTITKSIK